MIVLDPFYPVVPDASWVARLARQGAKLIQLRVKDKSQGAVEAEIEASLRHGAAHGCQVVVNDYWREAIALDADFIHLGQEDLAGADLVAIRAAKIKLGISTHSREELATALAADPDYVALGPIYPTKLKQMRWQPQGLARIAEWRSLTACPLVAIGGITVELAPFVLAAGADAAAVVTDIVADAHPDRRTQEWIAATAPWRQSLSTGHPQI